jgi:solute carrier family 6 amino acid transporter-like protein 5/7/9/14
MAKDLGQMKVRTNGEEVRTNEEEEEEEDDRGNWTGKLDFLLSCLGYAVGLGNVWRFPYLCFKHGGGAFLVPYFIMLTIIGIPCFLMELHLGQYSALGPVTVYTHLAPVFKGLGFCNFVTQSLVGIYYNMIIAWTIYYTFASFTTHLPWQDCTNDYNDEFCFSINDYKNCVEQRNISQDLIYINRTCTNDTAVMDAISSNYAYWYKHHKTKKLENGTSYKVDCIYTNSTFCDDSPGAIDRIKRPFDLPTGRRSTSSDQYLKRSVWQESDGLEPENMGTPLWGLVLSLLLAWIIIFGALFKGIKSSGRVVYVTATFPYVVLIILLVRAVTLPGASKGIYFYLYPDIEKLSNIKVWEAAAVQIFFSIGVGGGGLITLASYNKFNNNIIRCTWWKIENKCFF